MMKKSFKNELGFTHYLMLAVIVGVVGFATVGTYMVVKSHAATCTSYVYSQGVNGSVCVKYLQQLVNWQLTANAYSPLSIDGNFGPKTKSAVVSVQQKFHITADGVVGKQTWGYICYPQVGPRIPGSFPLMTARAAGCNI